MLPALLEGSPSDSMQSQWDHWLPVSGSLTHVPIYRVTFGFVANERKQFGGHHWVHASFQTDVMLGRQARSWKPWSRGEIRSYGLRGTFIKCNTIVLTGLKNKLPMLLLQWRHKECAESQITSVSNVYSTVCCVTGLCEGNSPVTDDFPIERASNAKNVFIW